MDFLGNSHQNLDYHVYQAIKEMIINRKLLPGTKILQDKLAKELGISRTPLINALKRLEHERLISAVPRRGFFVRLFTKSEMIQIFRLREVLEGLTTRRAAMLATDDQLRRISKFFAPFVDPSLLANIKRYAQEDRNFHREIILTGGEGMIAGILESIGFLNMSYQLRTHEGLVRPPEETYQEHLDIIAALQERNADRAEESMRKHLRASLNWLEKLSNHAEPDKS